MAVDLTRRETLAGGAALGWYFIAGSWIRATPAIAAEQGFTPQTLTPEQCQTVDVLGEALVPGAQRAGISAYIDNQLSAGTDSLLMAKYVGVPTDQQIGFYRSAIDAANIALNQANLRPPQLLSAMANDNVADWQGPPASFFFFLLRSDSLDVTYGTERGFAELDIPYMAHITPPKPW